MQRHNKNFRPSAAYIEIDPFNNVSPPSETEELARAVRELNMRLYQNQAETDRRNRELLKQKGQQNKAGNRVAAVAALQLLFSGDRVCIEGTAISKMVELRSVREGSGTLIEPLILFCKNNPYRFKNITLKGLQSVMEWQNNGLVEATKNIPLFWKYLSGIGLKGNLRKLFLAHSHKGLRFKFRTAVSQDEWSKLPPEVQQKLVKMLEGIGSSKTVSFQG